MMSVYYFLTGAVSLGFLICALCFLRFWRRTHDSLFLAFSLAFALLATGQSLLALANIPEENRAPVYLLRLGAFLVIIGAIVRKNRVTR